MNARSNLFSSILYRAWRHQPIPGVIPPRLCMFIPRGCFFRRMSQRNLTAALSGLGPPRAGNPRDQKKSIKNSVKDLLTIYIFYASFVQRPNWHGTDRKSHPGNKLTINKFIYIGIDSFMTSILLSFQIILLSRTIFGPSAFHHPPHCATFSVIRFQASNNCHQTVTRYINFKKWNKLRHSARGIHI